MRSLNIILIFLTFTSCGRNKTIDEVKVDLSGKNLTEVPDSIFKDAAITSLDLGSSDVQFYPPLSELVDTNSNRIRILPNKIGRLKNLKRLVVNSNMLTTLPDSIVHLINLEELDLSRNKNLDILQELQKLKQIPNLKVLKIVDVKMTADDFPLITTALGSDTKVITTISEYSMTKE